MISFRVRIHKLYWIISCTVAVWISTNIIANIRKQWLLLKTTHNQLTRTTKNSILLSKNNALQCKRVSKRSILHAKRRRESGNYVYAETVPPSKHSRTLASLQVASSWWPVCSTSNNCLELCHRTLESTSSSWPFLVTRPVLTSNQYCSSEQYTCF